MMKTSLLFCLLLFTVVSTKRVVRRRKGSKRINDESPCPESIGIQTYPDPKSCNSFFKCTNGTASHHVCENGLVFDPDKPYAVHNHCTYIWDGQCGDRELNDEKISSNNGCEYQFGLYALTECSSSYAKCSYGIPEEAHCEIGLVFDNAVHGCNWPDSVSECNSSELFGFDCPKTLEELKNPLNKRFFPFPRFAIQDHENLYLICVEGSPRLQHCGPGTVFDSDVLGCVEHE